ncbi:bifunctional enoyl-CoA hydratase/phosphate acetyltransferase [Xanthobacter autotrophicus]|uniref:bifunctional enoyl-CoA hydratase/phosphate acetyltransferase n=1 Tax=Xanthobacter autotrophicus TaxID=280 RepID=UPI0024A7992F|nr:bifunctional enoyl-CoA hydratase/phosphate acetyltransferase [Xanthobacter autotrophicus]MDI4656029.1 bifunctional enoyl-CoA hydratase/phosphate acetyltransferase [Xanthobacter autotrophicus]
MKRENRTFSELQVGDTAELRRICTADDLFVFATASGNHNPLHLPGYDLNHDGKHDEVTAPAMWVGSLISAVLGNILPGAGTRYRSQNFEFLHRAKAGDDLVVHVRITEKRDDGDVVLATSVSRENPQEVLLRGEAVVTAPRTKIAYEEQDIPGLLVQRHRHFDALVAQAETLEPLTVAVVAPEEANSLGGALLAARHRLIIPILIGARDKIEAAARECGESLDGIEILDVADHAAASHTAVDLVAQHRASALMKGHLHTDELLHAALRKENGLRGGRRFTHIFVMDVPGLAHPLLVTDAAINIQPDLATKIDIVQNAIDLAISLGIAQPKVGVLSAVETVNPQIASSVDAALLSKMAERGQITGGLVDGPLAMDNAIDVAAARTKGIVSPVAGHADILVVPNLDAGNMVAKQLTYVSHAEGAGLVMGAKVPIILTSRADSAKARLASCAVAAIHHARISALKAAVKDGAR